MAKKNKQTTFIVYRSPNHESFITTSELENSFLEEYFGRENKRLCSINSELKGIHKKYCEKEGEELELDVTGVCVYDRYIIKKGSCLKLLSSISAS